MRERVELAGGDLDVSPGDAGGTVISARLPLG
jgi:signal transduction histidine kinase